MNILQAIEHPDLFAPLFTKPSWEPWKTCLRAMFGLPMSEADIALFNQCTGRTTAPTKQFSEAWLICGRRAGKSFMMSLCAVYLSCFFNYRQYLNIGERATTMVIAADRKQARVIMRYIRGLFRLPALAKLVQNERAESFDLNNGVTIEVHTASYATTRGYSVCACLIDEAAFAGAEEGAVPLSEILRAIRPAMALIPNSILICASSPYARTGPLFKTFERHYAKDASNVLVWKAPTTTMNPSFPQEIVDAAIEEDLEAAKSEYLAEFRNDLSSYVDADVVNTCVMRGVFELPYMLGEQYVGFVDPSGGHSDSFTMAIATYRMDRDVRICQLACIREYRPPFNPSQIIEEMCQTLHAYGVNSVTSDRYAGEFPVEHFRNHGVLVEPSEKPKSDIYRDALPLLNSGRVELLDNNRLVSQICNLERRVTRGGRDSIDHPSGTGPNARDDVANSALGALVLASGMSADGFNLDMYMRAYGTKPDLYTERKMREKEEAERLAREAESQSSKAAESASLDTQSSSFADDSKRQSIPPIIQL